LCISDWQVRSWQVAPLEMFWRLNRQRRTKYIARLCNVT
jgi:hypothetical protein